VGQIEVFNWLKKQRLTGSDKYFTLEEIEKGLKESGCSNGMLRALRGDILKLELYDYLDVKLEGKFLTWNRKYRLKDKYLLTK